VIFSHLYYSCPIHLPIIENSLMRSNFEPKVWWWFKWRW